MQWVHRYAYCWSRLLRKICISKKSEIFCAKCATKIIMKCVSNTNNMTMQFYRLLNILCYGNCWVLLVLLDSPKSLLFSVIIWQTRFSRISRRKNVMLCLATLIHVTKTRGIYNDNNTFHCSRHPSGDEDKDESNNGPCIKQIHSDIVTVDVTESWELHLVVHTHD